MALTTEGQLQSVRKELRQIDDDFAAMAFELERLSKLGFAHLEFREREKQRRERGMKFGQIQSKMQDLNRARKKLEKELDKFEDLKRRALARRNK